MQENTESKKPNEAETPENEEELSDEKPTSKPSESSESEPSFEEQEGEVLPSENKKSSRYGLFLFILLLLTGGSSYLFYTDQIPPQIKEWIEPLLKPLEQRLAGIKPAPAPRPPKNIISEVNGISKLMNARFEVGEKFKQGEVLISIKDDDIGLELKSIKSQFLALCQSLEFTAHARVVGFQRKRTPDRWHSKVLQNVI